MRDDNIVFLVANDDDNERNIGEPIQHCPQLVGGRPCGRPLKDRSTSAIAGSEKCVEHSRMRKLFS